MRRNVRSVILPVVCVHARNFSSVLSPPDVGVGVAGNVNVCARAVCVQDLRKVAGILNVCVRVVCVRAHKKSWQD